MARGQKYTKLRQGDDTLEGRKSDLRQRTSYATSQNSVPSNIEGTFLKF